MTPQTEFTLSHNTPTEPPLIHTHKHSNTTKATKDNDDCQRRPKQADDRKQREKTLHCHWQVKKSYNKKITTTTPTKA